MDTALFTETLLTGVKKTFDLDITAVDEFNSIDDANLTQEEEWSRIAAENAIVEEALDNADVYIFVRDHLDGKQTLIKTHFILAYGYLMNYPDLTPAEKVAEALTWINDDFGSQTRNLQIWQMVSNAAISARDRAAIETVLNKIHEITAA